LNVTEGGYYQAGGKEEFQKEWTVIQMVTDKT
jgi:hypothetical protein